MSLKAISRLLPLAAVALMTGCQSEVIYSHYKSVPFYGWQREDTVCFDIGPVTDSLLYDETLSLRAGTAYPFMDLSLIVRQQIWPSGITRCDTLLIPIIDKNGTMIGHGANYHQYNIQMTPMQLRTGDSLHISIRHNMKRQSLRGIADVGITLANY